MKFVIGLFSKLFTNNPIVGGMLALILLQAIGFGVVSWKFNHRTEQLEDMTALRLTERSNHRQTKANYRAAMAQAKLDQAAAIAARETQWRTQSNATETKIRDELGTALAAADAYINRLRSAAKAGTGAGGGTGANQTAGAATLAAQPVGPGGMPQLDASDVRICTVNTVEYRQLKALYEKLRAESRQAAPK
jgi:hypothetical protein